MVLKQISAKLFFTVSIYQLIYKPVEDKGVVLNFRAIAYISISLTQTHMHKTSHSVNSIINKAVVSCIMQQTTIKQLSCQVCRLSDPWLLLGLTLTLWRFFSYRLISLIGRAENAMCSRCWAVISPTEGRLLDSQSHLYFSFCSVRHVMSKIAPGYSNLSALTLFWNMRTSWTMRHPSSHRRRYMKNENHIDEKSDS